MPDLAPLGTAHGFALDGVTPQDDVNAPVVIDGNDATSWVTGGGGGVWVLTLPSALEVNDTIRVHWIGNTGAIMHVDTSVDGSTWVDAGLDHTQTVEYDGGSAHVFDVSGAPITSRYWRWRTTNPSIGSFALETFELNTNHKANVLHSTVHLAPARGQARAGTLHTQLHLVSTIRDLVVADFYRGVAPAPPAVMHGSAAQRMLAYLPSYYP